MSDQTIASCLRGVFETHLCVADLTRSRKFYEADLGLELGLLDRERKSALYWVGPERAAMLGIWERPPWQKTPPHITIGSCHFAFSVDWNDFERATARLRDRGVELTDYFGRVTTEPSVFAWMPAASLYFFDPDGNLLEVIARLEAMARPELGVLSLHAWHALQKNR